MALLASRSCPKITKFSVRRRDAVLVAPSRPTPREFKLLSDIDDQQGNRFQIPFIQFYRKSSTTTTPLPPDDPAPLIRDALAQALVFYYPFAGRIREGAGRKLAVECTGEGVVFIEADADVSLQQLNGDDDHPLRPPFPAPWLDQLLFDVPGTSAIVGCPLLLIQVTRLTCGGFVFALRLNHAISDGPGAAQFMHAVADLARGARTLSVEPVWERHLFSARDPPRVTCRHREYEYEHGEAEAEANKATLHLHHMAHRSFSFGPREMAAIRSHLPPHLRASFTTFDLLVACFWRCRSLALQPHPHHQMRIICIVNTRRKLQPPAPAGYYGSAAAFPVAMAPAGELYRNPVGYAVELISRSKKEVTAEYAQSAADLLATKGRPHFTAVPGTCCAVSDMRYVDFEGVDFGWGRAVYGGPALASAGVVPGFISCLLPLRKEPKDDGIVLLCCLPPPAMDRFAVEIEKMIRGPTERKRKTLKSPL